MNFEKPEDVLISPIDGEEFVIIWNVNLIGQSMKRSEVPVIAFERTGKDGKRYVLRGRGDIKEMSESELRSAPFPTGYIFPF